MTGTPVPSAFLPRYLCPRCGSVLNYGELDLNTGTTPVSCPTCAKQWTINAVAGAPDPQTGQRGSVTFSLQEVA